MSAMPETAPSWVRDLADHLGTLERRPKGASVPLDRDVTVSLVYDALGIGPDEFAGQGWQDLARCRETDPEVFFPEKGGSTREAKRTCRACEVRAECLEYAMDRDERYGIWGGLSERERRRLRRQAA